MNNSEFLGERTVRDFGDQWTRYTTNDGFYGSSELLQDIVGPLVDRNQLQDAQIIEIGSGSGRIALMLAEAGAAQVTATEPSDGYESLVKNISESPWSNKIQMKRIRGDELNETNAYDLVFSVGVLHHVLEPIPILQAAYQALKPGGKIFIWLYGREGNTLYLAITKPLRALTTRLPHILLIALVWLIYFGLVIYRVLCRIFPLPLKAYITNILWNVTPEKRRLVIYDQLNPAYAKYYSEAEVKELLTAGGFAELRLHHRHGYSWAAIGTKRME